MKERVMGNFPVFAEDADFTKRKDFSDFPIPLSSDIYKATPTGYLKGFDNVNPELLNAVLQYVTQHVSYLYERGVPEYSISVRYPKGATVQYEGKLYISFVDYNDKLPIQSAYWGEVTIKPNSSQYAPKGKVNYDEEVFPIGTILTVPKTVSKTGFIDYVEGSSFSSSLYPELYAVLGTDTFATTNTTVEPSLPIGSIIPVLNTDPAPEGYIELAGAVNVLLPYPELKQVLINMANRLTDVGLKTIWLEALNNNSLPNILNQHWFMRKGNDVGLVLGESLPNINLLTLPVLVQDETLNPLGYTGNFNDIVTPLTFNGKSNTSGLISDIALVGKEVSVLRGTKDTSFTETILSKGTGELAPKSLTVKFLIKAVGKTEINVPITHKRIIRAK